MIRTVQDLDLEQKYDLQLPVRGEVRLVYGAEVKSNKIGETCLFATVDGELFCFSPNTKVSKVKLIEEKYRAVEAVPTTL